MIEGFVESKKITKSFEVSAFDGESVQNMFKKIIFEAYKYKYENPVRDKIM